MTKFNAIFCFISDKTENKRKQIIKKRPTVCRGDKTFVRFCLYGRISSKKAPENARYTSSDNREKTCSGKWFCSSTSWYSKSLVWSRKHVQTVQSTTFTTCSKSEHTNSRRGTRLSLYSNVELNGNPHIWGDIETTDEWLFNVANKLRWLKWSKNLNSKKNPQTCTNKFRCRQKTHGLH